MWPKRGGSDEVSSSAAPAAALQPVSSILCQHDATPNVAPQHSQRLLPATTCIRRRSRTCSTIAIGTATGNAIAIAAGWVFGACRMIASEVASGRSNSHALWISCDIVDLASALDHQSPDRCNRSDRHLLPRRRSPDARFRARARSDVPGSRRRRDAQTAFDDSDARGMEMTHSPARLRPPICSPGLEPLPQSLVPRSK